MAAAAAHRVGAQDIGASRQALEPGTDEPAGPAVARAVDLAAMYPGLREVATAGEESRGGG